MDLGVCHILRFALTVEFIPTRFILKLIFSLNFIVLLCIFFLNVFLN